MGLGKTAQALVAAEGRTLVVAPAILLSQWEQEAEVWAPDLDLTRVSYHSLIQREKTARGGTTVTNRLRQEYAQPYDTVIFDEAHHLKNRSTSWTGATLRERWKLWSDSNLWLLSGTPVPNWGHELYVPIRLMHDQQDRRYSSYWRWVREWFQTWSPPYAPNSIEIRELRPDRTWPQFQEQNGLDSMVLRRVRDDVLTELPPLTQSVLWLDMTSSQRKAYDEMRRDFITYLEETGQYEVALSSGSRAVKLYKLTTGTPAVDPLAPLTGSNKLQALNDILRERSGLPTVVFTYYRNTAAVAAKIAESYGEVARVDGGVPLTYRMQMVERFREGRISTLVGTLATLREGLNLQVADVAVMVEHSPRPSDNDQAIRRIHRIGQTRPVHVIHLATRKSLDEHLRRRLRDKRTQSSQAIRVTREDL